ncbi:Zinc transporter 2 [Aphelenchoides bicaudatus]|nr:Zinc transporter 2 [Aphelenchoides bicaudatus]
MMSEHDTNNAFPLIDIKYKSDTSEITYLQNGTIMGLSQKEEFPLKSCEQEMAFQKSLRDAGSRRAEKTLMVVSVLTIIFIIAELVGGILAHSIAIFSDAFHMLSDLGSFFISIMAIHLARRQPNAKYSFGFQRAEILGALTSIIIIWVLTGILVYMAIVRIINHDLAVEPDTMMITAGIGVLFNIIMGATLHFFGKGSVGHSHFGMPHSHSHGEHGHSHGGHSHGKHEHSHKHSDISVSDLEEGKKAGGIGVLAVPLPTAEHHGHSHKHEEQHTNLNLRAALIHVLGDLVQSVGVLIAAVIIKFTGFELADPICTFLFGILVLFTTVGVLKDTLHVLMEATPSHISLGKVCSDLMSIEGVAGVHSLRIWSLKLDSVAISVHLDTIAGTDVSYVVREAQSKLKHLHFDFVTVQAQCSLSRTPSQNQLLAP